MKHNLKQWFDDGTPWIWANAGAVAISLVMVVGLLALLAVKGLVYFWPADVFRAVYAPPVVAGETIVTEIIGEIVQSERVIASQIISSGVPVDEDQDLYERYLIKLGNRDITGADFSWAL
ncbi:MAG: phosphate ABC transporter, permease protein PstA, partial [Pseudohongiellaceae bacterium]